MPYRFDLHVRLEAVHTVHDLKAVEAAVRAEVHDPVWFLGRQWQLGEHRGTDAASPGLVHVAVTETAVDGRSTAPEDDPRVTPPEAVIESEPEQWWTVGRRVRVGRVLRSAVPAARRNDPTLLLAGLVPPYEALNGRALDGLALYRSRASLGLTDTQFAAQGVPETEPVDDWDPAELAYSATFSAGPTTLTIPRHDGGDVDWYSATATGPNPPAAPPPTVRTSYPTRVAYDGAPHPRWWQVEQRRYDPGAVPPHRTRLASLLLINLTASHGDNWFTAPLLSPTGTLVAVDDVQVEDVMGLTTKKAAVSDWSFFRVSGRGTAELLIWPTVANPLTAPTALDDVVLGVDEDANVLWAIEQRVDGVELVEPDPPAAEAPVTPPAGQVVVTGKRRYRYVPATTVPHLWHPYISSDTGNVRRFVQGRLADLSVRPVAPRPGPTSRLLRDPAAGPEDPAHQIVPAAIPRAGLRIDRRYALGRRVDGQPVLWVQRRRTPLFAPPASELRFDVLEEILEIRS
ncbi:MAG TPA: hypothetical protein VEK09_12285 [Jatrophihabitantaceae bacterium]|nr:hypothetical protein [Jatrophihabitantaceae bacterium]